MAKPYGLAIWFSQSEVVLHSNLLNLGERDKECSLEALMNTDPDFTERAV